MCIEMYMYNNVVIYLCSHSVIYVDFAHAQDARKSEDIHNFSSTEWTETEGGVVTRSLTYEVTKNLGFTTANIKVSQIHVGAASVHALIIVNHFGFI